MILLLPLIILFSSFAEDRELKKWNVSIGTDVSQTTYKSGQRFVFTDNKAFTQNFEASKVALNITVKPFKKLYLWAGIRPNIGLNFTKTQIALDTVANQLVRITSKSISNSFFIATALHKRILPFAIATHYTSISSVRYANGFIVDSKKSSILYGLGLTTPIGKVGTLSLTRYFSNSTFGISAVDVISYNHFL